MFHHRGTEDAEEFFAFREIPKGENSLFSINVIRKSVRMVKAEYFCLSVSPDKQKMFSVPSVSLW
jgi:hypothetical protein